MSGPFKMKGSPIKRNFGIGASPAKNYREPKKGNQAALHNQDYPSPEHTARHEERDTKKSVVKKRTGKHTIWLDE